MTLHARTATMLLIALSIASNGWAQPPAEAREAVERMVEPGEMVTVTTVDRRQAKGRFLIAREEGLVFEVDGRERPVAWANIERIRRRRNWTLVGAIIGTAAGIVAGIPLYQIGKNETGKGAKQMATMIAIGFGAGVGIDALFSTNRTVYRRRVPNSMVQVQPRKGGAAVQWGVAW